LFGLAPKQRGLARLPDVQAWSFPDDYLQRLRNLLEEAK
jgi:hypothetical protein